jgi:hypothetical protein
MATTTPPPEPARPGSPYGFGLGAGSGEFAVYLLALIVAWLVCWIADELNAGSWLDFFKWATAAYLLSRGIAKASRVFEY